jgi:hypothetical protein
MPGRVRPRMSRSIAACKRGTDPHLALASLDLT